MLLIQRKKTDLNHKILAKKNVACALTASTFPEAMIESSLTTLQNEIDKTEEDIDGWETFLITVHGI